MTTVLRNSIEGTEVTNDQADTFADITDAKAWVKMEYDNDDTAVLGSFHTARKLVEKYSGVGFGTRDIVDTIQHSAQIPVKLSMFPVNDVTSVEFRASRFADWETLTEDTDYELTNGKLFGKNPGFYKVTYNAGYDLDDFVPYEVTLSIQRVMARLYLNRGDILQSQFTKQDLDTINTFARRFWV